MVKRPRVTVSKALRIAGFVRYGMGGNTSAWKDTDSDGAEMYVTDGDHRAPTRWADPALVSVDLLDLRGEPIASYDRRFPTVQNLIDWLYSREAVTLQAIETLEEADLTSRGFVSAD
jgi:hypothetical protein